MSCLKVAIVHYHLKRGGVTKVIESTIRGFESRPGSPGFAVLAGDLPHAFPYREYAAQVDGLNYSNLQETTPDPLELLERLRDAAKSILGCPPDIWHIHNHSLGKNTALPGIVSLLAQSGEKLLLHMHDFSEDGRPANYRVNRKNRQYADQLYPDGKGIHYGFINNRDREIFLRSGFPDNRLHYLGNPVEAGQIQCSAATRDAIFSELRANRLFLYPVRAVRRKNFGEMLFWSILAEDGDVFATTLGPTNSDFIPQYELWKDFARRYGLGARFEIGEQYRWSFAEIVGSSDYILTTSIAEGFGLAFLEPVLFGKFLLGRDLPEITRDFSDLGITSDHMYNSLPVPEYWLDMDCLRSVISRTMRETFQAYDSVIPDGALDAAISAISPIPGYIDFGGLDEDMQRSIMTRMLEDPGCRDELPIGKLIPGNIHQQSADSIDGFGPKAYCNHLLDTYNTIQSAESKVDGFFDQDRILCQFLLPERFRLLRT